MGITNNNVKAFAVAAVGTAVGGAVVATAGVAGVAAGAAVDAAAVGFDVATTVGLGFVFVGSMGALAAGLATARYYKSPVSALLGGFMGSAGGFVVAFNLIATDKNDISVSVPLENSTIELSDSGAVTRTQDSRMTLSNGLPLTFG